MWKNEKFSLTKKIFRQINSLVTYLSSKTVTFTKFLPKMREKIPVISQKNALKIRDNGHEIRSDWHFITVVRKEQIMIS